MDRNREGRRVSMAASNGLSRRRHRSSSLRDSPEDDGPVELQETARLRDRKKDRDRDRDRERDREREKDRERDRISRGKRRRGDRLMHGSNREDGERDDSSDEESVNDDEDEDDDDGVAVPGSSMRMLPPNPSSLSSSMSNHHHRKSFPPPAKVFRAAPTGITTVAATPWKATDEMIGVSVPRKARSASTKRSHECWASSGGVGNEPIHRQASTSPVRSSGPAVFASASASPAAPVSPPSSSNVSVKKKMKPNGPKQRPPKSSSKSSSSAQDEIEFEIAEVLYGLMRQPQVPTKQEIVGNDLMKFDSREVNNKSTSDAKSRVSSPISNSQSTMPQSSSILQSNSSSSAGPMSAIAPKRKRPRPVKYEDEHPGTFPVRNSSMSSTAKVDIDQHLKIESSPNLEKNSGSTAENAGVSYDLLANQAAPAATEAELPELVKPENHLLSDSKPMTEESENRDLVGAAKEEPRSPKKESTSSLRLEDDRESLTVTKGSLMNYENDAHREEKFQIDLMAPPPSRSSPERDSEIDFVAVDPKPMVTDAETEKKPTVKADEKALKIGKEDINVEPEEKKTKMIGEDVAFHKPIANKERNIDLQLDLEKADRDSVTVTVSGNKLHQQHVQKQQPNAEKTAQSGSLPLPMPMAGWPSGLPHMGYMAPLQGVVSMDGSTVSSAAIPPPPHLIFSQPRPKKCATHCYIARNIHCYQQFTRMNPFWPPAAGSALQYKACNMSVVPSNEMHASRVVNSMQEKGQGLAMVPGHSGKEKSSQASNNVDAAQRKQILLQQALPQGAPSNILHGPTFIFPLSQQQAAAAAASVRPGSMKSSPAAGSAASSSTSSSASMNATATAVAGATAMSFNYPNMPGNETQYLAILQNGAYPITIPPHVGATPAYRGTHPQAMPFFNGSFYSSQMLHPHPSQLQQQQPPPTQSQQSQQGHQNPSISSGSSSSQKHLQNQQQRPHGSGVSGGSGNFQGFPASKNQPPQSLPHQQRQQMHNQSIPHQARQLESELGGEDSPSTADSRVSRANMGIYGHSFAMPMHAANFALMNPPSMGGASGASGNPGEKKQQQQQQPHAQTQASKAGIEPLQSQAFPMSFTSINGPTTAPGLDISSLTQNHAILQSLPEATRHGYHFLAATQAAQQKKSFHISEEGKTGKDASNAEEERKAMAGGKTPATSGQSIAFSRPDLTDASVSVMQVNNVIDSSARTLNLGSTPRTSGSLMSAAISTVNASNMQQQQQLKPNQQQHLPHVLQLQKQHPFAAVATASARSKTPAISNGNVYSDHISSSPSMGTKFPNALSAFPQNLVQSSSPAHSPQWKNSMRTSQAPSPSPTTTSSTHKNLPQQQARSQQGHTQISFAANPKPSMAPQGQPTPSSTQSPSPPMLVGSPTSSSISKSAGGSPRTSTSTSNKGGQSSTLSSQQAKNSTSVPAQKSSPVGGRNIPSILGHPHNATSSSNSGVKPQMSQQSQQQLMLQQQQQQQLLSKQTQIMYTSAAIMQAQHAASSTNTTSAPSGYYLQRHRGEQQQHPQGSSATSSTGMLSLCPPVTIANTSTTDPAKAVAAAAANMKGGGLPSQSLIHAQFAAAQSSGKILSAGFPCVHAVPAVQVKPTEQKQPAGE